ncbi:MAG: HAD family hydrolase [Arcticibacter sp.]
MTKKALILDLDNTLYSVQSIGDELFKPLFELIEKTGEFSGDMNQIKADIMRKPFQLVAEDYQFSEDLIRQSTELLQDLTVEGKIEPFEDYAELKKLPIDKFLVTTGFMKLQQSKVQGMNLDDDFKEIHIVDPATSKLSKKDVFIGIIKRYEYELEEVLVIGDDPDSEIEAGIVLGTPVLLYDKLNRVDDAGTTEKIRDFRQLADYLR